MKTVFKSILAAASITLMSASVQAATSLEDLLQEVKKNRVSEARINKQREAEFQSARADKQALLRKAKSQLKSEKSRGVRLAKAFADNEVRLAEKEVELVAATGNLGEMFGVVRQASAEAYGQISTSIVSAEFPGRAERPEGSWSAPGLGVLSQEGCQCAEQFDNYWELPALPSPVC